MSENEQRSEQQFYVHGADVVSLCRHPYCELLRRNRSRIVEEIRKVDVIHT